MRRADWVIELKASQPDRWHGVRALNRRKLSVESEEWTAGRELNEHKVSRYGHVMGHQSIGDALCHLLQYRDEHPNAILFKWGDLVFRFRNRQTGQFVLYKAHRA